MSDKRAPRRSLDDWMELVTECRQSGLTDAAWCEAQGISPSCFYNAVSRLRKRACQIPDPIGKASTLDLTSHKQDLIYCTYKGKDSKLIRYDLENQKSKKLAENIQKFYAGQEIYVQNGTQIVSISYDGKNIVSKVKDAIMIKYKAKKIYFLKTKEEDGLLKFEKKGKGYQVYEYDTETGKENEKNVVKKIEVQE